MATTEAIANFSETSTQNGTTTTSLDQQSRSIWFTILLIESMVILSTNTLALRIFCRRRFLEMKPVYLLISLTVGDLMTGVASLVAAVAVYFDAYKDFSSAFGIGYNACFYFTGGVSLTMLTAIAVERAYGTFKPFQHRTLEEKYYYGGIALAWGVAAIRGALTTAVEISKGKQRLITEKTSLVMKTNSALTIGLFAILVLSYTSMFIKQTFFNKFPNNSTVRNNKKLAKTLFIATMILAGTWFLRVGLMTYVSSTGSRLERSKGIHVSLAADVMAFSNSFFNLVVYTLRTEAFKKEARKVICCYGNNRVGQALAHVQSGTTQCTHLKSSVIDGIPVEQTNSFLGKGRADGQENDKQVNQNVHVEPGKYGASSSIIQVMEVVDQTNTATVDNTGRIDQEHGRHGDQVIEVEPGEYGKTSTIIPVMEVVDQTNTATAENTERIDQENGSHDDQVREWQPGE